MEIVKNFLEYNDIPTERMDYILNYEKNDLIKSLFGDELILKKEINIDIPEFELRSQILEKLKYHPFFRECVKAYAQKTDEIKALILSSFLIDSLVIGYAIGDEEKYPYIKGIKEKTFEINGITISLQKGRKINKLFREFSLALNMADLYEEFRLEYSRIFNVKKFKGNLCLSIHPMDFLTMSNDGSDNYWSSCYNINHGEFKTAPFILMRDPNMILCYIESNSDHIEFNDFEWNVKKWRNKIYVNPLGTIVPIFGHPYDSKVLDKEVLEWIQTLLQDKKPLHFYPQERDVRVVLKNNLLYNDIEETASWKKEYSLSPYKGSNYSDDTVWIFIDGDLTCLKCGESLPHSSVLQCPDCGGYDLCEECGAPIIDLDEYENCLVIEDKIYHAECVDRNEVTSCAICKNLIFEKNSIFIVDKDTQKSITVCEKCFHSLLDEGEYENLFTKLYDKVYVIDKNNYLHRILFS